MKRLFFILQLLLLTFGPYTVVGQVSRKVPDQKEYTAVTGSNLFNLFAQGPPPDQEASPTEAFKKPLQKTLLQLALRGTVAATSKNASFAVIENKNTGVQFLFQVGDRVEGATIKKIDRSQIILRVNGQDQILEVDITESPSSPMASKMALPTPQTEVSQTGLPALMKQARIRPFFSDGKPNGLLLYGIRNDSVFQQIGLKNGDIIKAINGNQTLSAKDALTIYQSLDASLEDISNIRFTILRRGKTQEIFYNAQDTE